jgi:excisionase family DNA binding protein
MNGMAQSLSPSQVACILNVCTVTVYRLIDQGLLVAHYLNDGSRPRLRITEADLERYRKRNKR